MSRWIWLLAFLLAAPAGADDLACKTFDTCAASGGSSGITIGTTTNTCATNGGVLFNAGGVVSCDADITFATDKLTVVNALIGTGIDIGNTDTTITRSSAGVIAVEGVALSAFNPNSTGTILPGSSTKDLGAAATPYQFLFLHGAGTYATGSLKFTGTPTGARVITFPDATDTVAVLGTYQAWTARHDFSVAGLNGIFANNGYFAWDSANANNTITFATNQTPDGWMVGTGTVGNSIHIAEHADFNSGGSFDFQNGPCGTSVCTNPTLIGHSAAQSTAQWWSLTHDGSNTVLDTGTGGISIPDGVVNGAVVFASLGTPADGTQRYCNDCTQVSAFVDDTCAGSGTGAFAVRLNGAWKCFK